MSHHHQKYYERPDGYVYSPEELDAHRIPLPFRDRCVNFYVPFFKCQQIKTDNLFKTALAAIDQTLDHWGGECYKEKETMQIVLKQLTNIPWPSLFKIFILPIHGMLVKKLFHPNQKNHFSSPVLY